MREVSDMTEIQTDLFGEKPVFFDGETYAAEHDKDRLVSQLERVKYLMSDCRWRTLSAISHITHGTEAAVSARLRDLRKERFGSHTVDRRPVGSRKNGLFEYRVTKKAPGVVS